MKNFQGRIDRIRQNLGISVSQLRDRLRILRWIDGRLVDERGRRPARWEKGLSIIMDMDRVSLFEEGSVEMRTMRVAPEDSG